MLQRRTWRGIREQRCGEQRIRRACCGSKCGEKERPQEVEHLLVGATRRTLGANRGAHLSPIWHVPPRVLRGCIFTRRKDYAIFKA